MMKFNELITKKGLTLDDFCKKSGLNTNLVNRWINGYEKPSNSDAVKMKEILKVPIKTIREVLENSNPGNREKRRCRYEKCKKIFEVKAGNQLYCKKGCKVKEDGDKRKKQTQKVRLLEGKEKKYNVTTSIPNLYMEKGLSVLEKEYTHEEIEKATEKFLSNKGNKITKVVQTGRGYVDYVLELECDTIKGLNIRP